MDNSILQSNCLFKHPIVNCLQKPFCQVLKTLQLYQYFSRVYFRLEGGNPSVSDKKIMKVFDVVS